MRVVRAIAITALLVLLLPGVAQATDQGKALKYGGGGLGTVIFDGRMHSGKGYVCKDCHNDLFVTKKQARVRMSDHFSDQLCFKCHDNKEAPRDCITCHRSIKSSGLTSSDYMRSAMALPTASEEERNALLTGRDGASAQTRACLSCHGDPELKAQTERGKTLNLLVERSAYGVGTHGALPCAACHFGLEGEASFTKQPHALDQRKVDCKSCHIERLAPEVTAFDASAHMQKTDGKFTCVNCHNPHSQSQSGKKPEYMAAVTKYNQTCLSCHANPERFSQLTTTPLNLTGMEHSFMTKFQAHKENVLCVDCHSAMGQGALGAAPHQIVEKSQALRNCSSCHRDMDSLIVTRVAVRDGNADALGGSYIPGNKTPGPLDRIGGWALMGVLAAVLLHSAARLLGKKKTSADERKRAYYIYPLPIRLFHWVNALCFVLLLWTGMGIHFEGLPTSPGLELATRIHNWVAYLLVANFASFLIYGIASGDIRQYLPKGPGIVSRILTQARYYLSGIFSGADKPFTTSREQRFNPLQQITYLVVFILGMPVLILSGVLLLLPESSTAGIAPRDTLATAHYCLAIGYGLFLVVHLYLTTTGDGIFSLIKAMFSGYGEYREKTANTKESTE